MKLASAFLLCSILWAGVFGYIPVFVMLPLNTVLNNNELNNPSQLLQDFYQLKNGGIDGIMTDVWWGLVENDGPQQYNWTAYQSLFSLAQQAGLKVQAVMSFHQCGTNVGDQCYIPLPSWVVSVGNSNPDIWYRDPQLGTDQEYLSLGVDDQALFQGRTGAQLYSDYMQSFANTFSDLMGSTIVQIQVGLGPAGEMRYPSYQLQDNKWSYCGIGEFQCQDKYMQASLQQAAQQAGHPEWGYTPNNAGTYDSAPSQTAFFSDNNANNYDSSYGDFFIGWYSNMLLKHGSTILSSASSIFGSYSGVSVAAKVSGIHWWYSTYSHAAEVTAGYFNTDFNNAYLIISQMFAQYGVSIDFTCLEMTNNPNNCGSAPQSLLQQVFQAAQQAGIAFGGENALDLCDPNCSSSQFQQVVTSSTAYGTIHSFTYLRLNQGMLQGNNWNIFTNFVNQMHNA